MGSVDSAPLGGMAWTGIGVSQLPLTLLDHYWMGKLGCFINVKGTDSGIGAERLGPLNPQSKLPYLGTHLTLLHLFVPDFVSNSP